MSDNGSTDDTAEVVQRYIDTHPNYSIIYLRQTTNRGFDGNVLAVVEAARGKHCWLLGDDDIIINDGITRILSEVTAEPNLDLIAVNFSRYNKRKEKVDKPKMISLHEDVTTTNADTFFFTPLPAGSYFYQLGVNCITVSINVIKRSTWIEAAKKVEPYMGYNFIHVFVFGIMMQQSGTLKFLATPYIQYLELNHRNWGNNIWQDYKQVYLNFLQELGYDATAIAKMQAGNISRTTLYQHTVRTVLRIPVMGRWSQRLFHKWQDRNA